MWLLCNGLYYYVSSTVIEKYMEAAKRKRSERSKPPVKKISKPDTEKKDLLLHQKMASESTVHC